MVAVPYIIYRNMIFTDTNELASEYKNNLLKYFKLDTLAMVKVLVKLKAITL